MKYRIIESLSPLTNTRVIPYQITQKKKIFPVQIIDFDEILLIKTLIQFIGPCKILFLYSK